MLQKFMNKPRTLAGINGAEVKLSEGVGQFYPFSDTQTTNSNPKVEGPSHGERGRESKSCRGAMSPLPALLQLIYSHTDSSFVKHHQGPRPLGAQLPAQAPGFPWEPSPWVI